MGRDPTRNSMREHIAHLAARLMAEDGIEDFATAKRKAAKQAGAPDTRQLPDNEEIEAALRTYRALYQQQHPEELRNLRKLALEVMSEFASFHPHLTGPVLSGTAGQFADVHLQLFVESDKTVEIELLNRGIQYRTSLSHLHIGEMPVEVPVLSFEREDVTFHLALLSPLERRTRIRSGRGGRVIERADLDAVATLVALS